MHFICSESVKIMLLFLQNLLNTKNLCMSETETKYCFALFSDDDILSVKFNVVIRTTSIPTYFKLNVDC